MELSLCATRRKGRVLPGPTALSFKNYARVECKTSTADGYEGVLRLYLRPRFGTQLLDEVKRTAIKDVVSDLISDKLSRNTIRNAMCVIRAIFYDAIEAGVVESNPAARLGRFTRTPRAGEKKGIALTSNEAQQFLEAAKIVCAECFPLFLTALRAWPGRVGRVAVGRYPVWLGR